MNSENFLIERLVFKDKKLYIYCRHYYNEEHDYFKKILCFQNVKSFTNTLEELVYSDEMYEYLKELGMKYFERVFYKNKKTRKIYIFDGNYRNTVIEFSEKTEWNYREQKKRPISMEEYKQEPPISIQKHKQGGIITNFLLQISRITEEIWKRIPFI